jgi:hypothetical protein
VKLISAAKVEVLLIPGTGQSGCGLDAGFATAKDSSSRSPVVRSRRDCMSAPVQCSQQVSLMAKARIGDVEAEPINNRTVRPRLE